jgi:hypothetical protein
MTLEFGNLEVFEVADSARGNSTGLGGVSSHSTIKFHEN